VNWCKAYYYCKAVGKRLCGKIGAASNDYDAATNVDQNQWYRACTSGGLHAYPYGDTRQSEYCNGKDYSSGVEHFTMPVASLSTCQSAVDGYSGVYDLSGNVWEWEDSCDLKDGVWGTWDNCQLRGGSYINMSDTAGYLACGHLASTRAGGSVAIGFRCCGP
jgi:formylglycine-generating enzyme required for sulfatase activity